MTLEEIKSTYTMRDILARYGLEPNRAGFIRCPFHPGDRQASLKAYKRDFHCFGCGANGDVIDFVRLMEGVSFADAFRELGGTYESKQTFGGRLAIYRAEKRRQMARKQAERLQDKKDTNNMLINVYRAYMERSEPLSDAWCDCYNALQYQLYLHGELNGIPY